MIKYEPDTSSFFTAHKNYCENIVNNLKANNLECTGWCNSFGYDFETRFMEDSLTYTIRFHKHQSTQNGVIIPVNAINYAGIVVTVSGLSNHYKIVFGKSILRRLFTSKRFKYMVPKPYFIAINFLAHISFVELFWDTLHENQISFFKLSSGSLICKIHEATIHPLDLINNIKKIISNLA